MTENHAMMGWEEMGGGWWELTGEYRAEKIGWGPWHLYEYADGAYVHCWQGAAPHPASAVRQYERDDDDGFEAY